MKLLQVMSGRIFQLALVLGMALLIAGTDDAAAGEKYKLEGTFIEGCNCPIPCPCELSDVNHGCEGVGVFLLKGGEFMDVDLKDARIAYAMAPGEWVRIYVQAINPVQREAAIAFAKAYFAPVGAIEETREAKIEVTGSDGKYTLSIDDGKTMMLTTEPVIGGDKKNPVKHENTKNMISPTMFQARTVSGLFSDGERKFELKDSNSYFNTDVNSKGSL